MPSKKPRSIPKETFQSSIYRMSDEDLGNFEVSRWSKYRELEWKFYNPTPGASQSSAVIRWDMILADGSSLSSHTTILSWLKKFVLTLLISPSKGRAPAASSFGKIASEIKVGVSWMISKAYEYPNEITTSSMDVYIDELPAFLGLEKAKEEAAADVAERAMAEDSDKASFMAFGEVPDNVLVVQENDAAANLGAGATDFEDDESDGVVGETRFVVALTLFFRLWEQRSAMAKFGISTITEHPFHGNGVITVARSLATKVRGWVLPIPDEVAIPLFNKAAWFLEAPANDVLALLSVVQDVDAGTIRSVDNGRGGMRTQKAGAGDQARRRRAATFFSNFRFSGKTGSTEPWHPPFQSDTFSNHLSLARIFKAVRSACCILVQGISGMRPSELIGIHHGIVPETGLPIGVRVEEVFNGLYEAFVIRTELSKGREGFGRKLDWVLGLRPKGDPDFPLAVKALITLNRIYEPWRKSSPSELLLLSIDTRGSLPKRTTKLQAMTGKRLTLSMKDFVMGYLDFSSLADSSEKFAEPGNLIAWRESNGRIINGIMLRKSWASFALACDSRLLPIIQLQFHHASLVTTEGSYIGKNPVLQEALNSVSVQKKNMMMFEMVNGAHPVSGKMGEKLLKELEVLRGRAGPLTKSDRWKLVVQWTHKNQIPMYFSEHSNCVPIQISAMRCHNEAETPIWLRKGPNYSAREPSTCAGCDCSVMDRSHQNFWEDRYLENSRCINDAMAAGRDVTSFREIRFRAKQASTILNAFGVNMKKFDSILKGPAHAK